MHLGVNLASVRTPTVYGFAILWQSWEHRVCAVTVLQRPDEQRRVRVASRCLRRAVRRWWWWWRCQVDVALQTTRQLQQVLGIVLVVRHVVGQVDG